MTTSKTNTNTNTDTDTTTNANANANADTNTDADAPGVVRDLSPAELASAAPRPRVVDVREPAEFTGELGHLADAELVPLGGLEQAAEGWPKEDPIILVCRSGARSARGAARLAQLGFRRVFNLAGGMLAHHGAGLPIERG